MVLSLAWGINDTIEINENKYVLNLEFSLVLRWYELWKDHSVSPNEKIAISIEMLLGMSIEKLPQEDVMQLFEAIIERIAGSDHSDKVVRDHAGNVLEDLEKRLYDLEEDAGYIYSSFMFDYGLDLMQEQENKSLHWDKFNALLIGLSEESKFRRVLEIRQMKIPPKASPEEIEKIQEAKRSVALKSNREAIEFEMMDLKQQREYMAKKEGGINGQ